MSNAHGVNQRLCQNQAVINHYLEDQSTKIGQQSMADEQLNIRD